MNILRRRKALRALNQYPPVPKEKVCALLEPYLFPYRLSLTETAIHFLPNTSDQPETDTSFDEAAFVCESIPFENIQSVKKAADRLELYLHTGYLVCFYDRQHKCRTIDFLEKKNPSDFTLGWWYIEGWCLGIWDELSYRYRHRHRLPNDR